MQDLLSGIPESITQAAYQGLLASGLQYFVAFTLIVVRVAGLMTIGPVFGHPSLPINIRILLVLTLSFLMAPAVLHESPWETVRRLDDNGDGRINLQETPERMRPRVARRLEELSLGENGSLTAEQLGLNLRPPRSLADFVWVGVGEFSLGLILGTGAMITLSGLQLAGQLIDQQSGIALGQIFNPALDSSDTLTSQTMYLLGLTLFLIIGGHVRLVTALLDTFEAFPPGQGVADPLALEFLHTLFVQSLVLALQIAAPMLATMSLVSLTMGYLGHTVPQINVLVVGFPIRSLVGLTILLFTFSGAGDVFIAAVDATLQGLGDTLIGLETGAFET